MTTEQQEVCIALGTVRYLPATWDKRFGQNIHGIATATPEHELTESQIEWMFRLLYKYRKQLPMTYAKHKGNPFCDKK